MTPIDPDMPPSVSLSYLEQVDEICNRYEACWRSGQRPEIKSYLDQAPAPVCELLLPELLALELDYRFKAGETPTLEEYQRRFPRASASVQTVFERYKLGDDAPTQRSAQAAAGDEHQTVARLDDGDAAPSFAGPINRDFGDYRLLEEIARGGMGVVYKARQRGLNRIVALKMIRSGQLADEQEVRRFRLEAEAAARLNHPNIVPIYEVGETQGQHYFSMAFVPGQSLAKRIAERPLTSPDAARLIRVAAEAVQAAHEQKVIHRDLKPANILLDESGQPHVTDFGLAKHAQDNSDLTATGQIIGTPGYMPPEQASGAGGDVGASADVYSLGASLYAAVTGRAPFQGPTPLDTVKQVTEREPVSPRQLIPSIDRDLETICLKCLQKPPERRYATAQALADDLRRYLAGEPILARPAGAIERMWRWQRRNPARAWLAVLAVLTVTAVLTLLVVGARLTATEKTASAGQLERAVQGRCSGSLTPRCPSRTRSGCRLKPPNNWPPRRSITQVFTMCATARRTRRWAGPTKRSTSCGRPRSSIRRPAILPNCATKPARAWLTSIYVRSPNSAIRASSPHGWRSAMTAGSWPSPKASIGGSVGVKVHRIPSCEVEHDLTYSSVHFGHLASQAPRARRLAVVGVQSRRPLAGRRHAQRRDSLLGPHEAAAQTRVCDHWRGPGSRFAHVFRR